MDSVLDEREGQNAFVCLGLAYPKGAEPSGFLELARQDHFALGLDVNFDVLRRRPIEFVEGDAGMDVAGPVDFVFGAVEVDVVGEEEMRTYDEKRH